ncbi:helicase-related protein [Saccharopolyspora gregorii]|uniref:Helicase C-terminal domain-containing protein n=1 Tax=Saccharopolyspora gregorii TaxID=33914 RepID=A0ABP6RTA1_9PSEU
MTIDTRFPDRDAILQYLHAQLVGPVDGPDEVLEAQPQQRYLSGILYPKKPPQRNGAAGNDPRSDGTADHEPVDEGGGRLSGTEDGDDDPITLSGQDRPSSVGISFVTTSWSAIEISVFAGRYRYRAANSWEREPVELSGDSSVHLEPPEEGRSGSRDLSVLGGDARVRVRWRPYRSGAIVTAVLVNEQTADVKARLNDAQCFFQVELRCRPVHGALDEYPGRRHLQDDDSADELELMYRSAPVYAVGHGSAADWDRIDPERGTRPGTPASVHTTFLPVHVVPDVAFDVAGPQEVFRLDRLAEAAEEAERTVAELTELVDRYASWLDDTRASLDANLAPHLSAAAGRLLERAGVAVDRMRRGIELVRTDEEVRASFALTNRIMLMQMVHGAAELAGAPHPVEEAPSLPEDYAEPGFRWRPFQLGFLLLTVEGIARECPDRDLVDLIWFPTGGGKTEAYLALAAFTIVHRRRTLGDTGAGTAIITRYTLRLLTAQQFQRTMTLIAACEVVRRERPDVLGAVPISIGIWVGGSNTPNTYAEARRLLGKLQRSLDDDAASEQSFQVDSCPWCGTRIMSDPHHDEREIGIEATNDTFRIHCLNPSCPFCTGLPVSSVDEDLYVHPPTLLMGTVDKFARTVWEERTGVFFGAGSTPGPSLIIQDEFHLISGPLGTVVGLYEAAFDVLMARHGARPKIIAATATIRDADEQVRGVFGREVALFPPSGIDAADSYFVRMRTDSPGRAYAGVMPQGHTPLTGLVHLAAAQLQAPKDVALSAEVEDSYSTLVAYHNSLRELGKTRTLARDDIPSRIAVIAAADDDRRRLDDDDIVELTSNVSASAIPKILERLARPHSSSDAVSFLASTNMLSVGVDIGRLGLMTVVGQPKTTAEYIQATSRVGRGRGRPGLVVTLYSPSKPRDRSHYESFVPYHSALYKSVEPSSVTPFSVAARERALHACLVVLVRHALGLQSNEDAARFDSADPELAQLLTAFLDRARRADPDEAERVETHLRHRGEEWARWLDEAAVEGGLVYRAADRKRPKLLRRHAEQGRGWATLDSMRSVDVNATVWVRRPLS